MFLVVFAISLANLLAGCAAGYWLARFEPVLFVGIRRWDELILPTAAPTHAVIAPVETITPPPAILLANFEAKHVQYQGQLQILQDQLRFATDPPQPELIGKCSQQLLQMNRQWLTQQNKVTEQLQADQRKLSALLAKDSRLCQMLQEQSAEVEASCQQIEQLGPNSKESARRLAAELSRLVGMSHRLHEALVEPAAGEPVFEGPVSYPAGPTRFAGMASAMIDY